MFTSLSLYHFSNGKGCMTPVGRLQKNVALSQHFLACKEQQIKLEMQQGGHVEHRKLLQNKHLFIWVLLLHFGFVHLIRKLFAKIY